MQDYIKLNQLSKGYRYNSDSLLLSDFALKMGLKNSILDVGSGCGVIGIILKSFICDLDLTLLDIQEENIVLMHQNLEQNNLKASIIHADFKTFRSDKKFDCIVCNPPYYRDGSKEGANAHTNISKLQKYLSLDPLILKCDTLLKSTGVLYFCYQALAFNNICLALANKELKLSKICFVHTCKQSCARLVLIQAKKNVKTPCEILPPLFVYENKILSKDMQEIHSRFRLKSYDV